MDKKKVVEDLGLNQRTATTACKHFDLPTSQKSGTRGMEGSKSKNSLGDHFVCQNDDFTHWGILRE